MIALVQTVDMPPRMNHQQVTVDKLHEMDGNLLITSDAGTGKTRCVLDYFAEIKAENPAARLLVLAPLSILEAAWGADIERWQPKLSYSVAYSNNRLKAFAADTDIVLTNHDAVKSLIKDGKFVAHLASFTHICIDEFTAYKNRESQRSKAMLGLTRMFDYAKILMSGTPDTNGILDIWHPMLILDSGQRLGKRFFQFREQVCTPRHNGFANEWIPKKDAAEIVAMQIEDINVRFKLEDCVDMPERTERTMEVTLPPAAMKAYQYLAQNRQLATAEGVIKAQHAGTLVRKLLQVCTGAAYDEKGDVVAVHTARYELVLDLVQERRASLVAFNYTHERDYLVEQAEKRGMRYGVIDGSVPASMRNEIVEAMQAGKLDVIFGQPQSMSHGLTLTRATAVIWCSPTYNAEHYIQFNARVYRKGQNEKTEIIRIAAKNTWEPAVYKQLEKKVDNMEALLTLLKHEVTGDTK